jgi:putative transposase
MSCSRQSTARRCCLGRSGGTWALYSMIGYLKGKSSIWIAQNVERKLRNFLGHEFWARDYFVWTVGRDEEMIRAYIRNQEMADRQLDQMQLKLASS